MESISLMNKNRSFLTILILFLVIASLFTLDAITYAGPKYSEDYNNIKCTRIIDGDTIKLETGERVRFIGVDTPESRSNKKLKRDMLKSGQDAEVILQMGKEAGKFTKSLVEGKNVILEFDVQRTDKYGRLLAYVYLEDGTFVNAEIVKQGYASLMTIPPNIKYVELFQKLFKEARENNRGLWK